MKWITCLQLNFKTMVFIFFGNSGLMAHEKRSFCPMNFEFATAVQTL